MSALTTMPNDLMTRRFPSKEQMIARRVVTGSPLKVYVAGPYSHGGTVPFALREGNVRDVIRAALKIKEMGHIPFIPHLTHYVEEVERSEVRAEDRLNYMDYLEWDFAWMDVCDVVVSIGRSSGERLERERAQANGQVWFDSLEQFEWWNKVLRGEE